MSTFDPGQRSSSFEQAGAPAPERPVEVKSSAPPTGPPAPPEVAPEEPAVSYGEPGVDSEQRAPSLRMLADRPLDEEDEDKLDFAVYAQALAELIDHPGTDTPLTIAISAPWGAGKTSLARLVQRRLETWRQQWGQPPHVVCWFNAWAHDDATHLGAAFAADVARKVDRARPWWQRLRSPLPAAMLTPRSRWRRRVLIALGALAVAVGLLFVPPLRDLAVSDDLEADLKGALGATLGSLAVLGVVLFVLWRYVLTASERAAKFIDDPGSEAARGSMREVSEELGELIAQATRGKRKVVVFVDDLERCRPPRAVQVCEAAANLLGHRDVVTILIADMRVIASSAELQYRGLESLDGDGAHPPGAYGRLYLQKIVQVQFDLPPPLGLERILVEEARAKPARHGVPVEGSRGQRVLDIALPAILLTLMVATGVAFAIWQPEGEAQNRVGAFFGGLFTAAFGFFVVAAIVRGVVRAGRFVVNIVRSRRARKRLTRIDRRIRESSEGSPATVEEDVDRTFAVDPKSAEAKLIADRVVRYFTHESSLQEEADAEVVKFLPLVPRGAKRMMNHLRLRLYVAIRRRLLEPGSGLTARHVGKWVVFEQRWPELAQEVADRVEVLSELEQVPEPKKLGGTLKRLRLSAAASDDLFEFLSTEPKLGPVAQELVYLEVPRA